MPHNSKGTLHYLRLEPKGVAFGWLQGALQALVVADPPDMEEALGSVVGGWMGQAEPALGGDAKAQEDIGAMLLGAFSTLHSRRSAKRLMEAAQHLGLLDGLPLGRHEEN